MDLPEGVTSGECPYCGSAATFPKLTDSRMESLYNRAEQFRQNNDFDRAEQAYEQLIQSSPDDPEVYWGLVLSRFGIEYVEDPVSRERIPTCHRVQYESITSDPDYLQALELASGYERDIYEKEAQRIAEIQKGILAISAQEKPYDVFICYKETTDGGSRTPDSADAQDIYYQLTNQGYKVFFSRITLEGKLGQEYEPYIFAALNSAKVMLVIGSKKEYFEAVWVRNEWSRFLALMKKDRSKLLIPCYKGISAYDLPEELSRFQAQDMSKIGFIQDILHGIKKVLNSQSGEQVRADLSGRLSLGRDSPHVREAMQHIERKEFAQALESCERAFRQEPENGYAYFCRLMAECGVSDEKTLSKIRNISLQKSFELAEKFADDGLRARLKKIFPH